MRPHADSHGDPSWNPGFNTRFQEACVEPNVQGRPALDGCRREKRSAQLPRSNECEPHGHSQLGASPGQRVLPWPALTAAPRCWPVALALEQPLAAARAGWSTACSCTAAAEAARSRSELWLAQAAATAQHGGAPRFSRRYVRQLTVPVHAAHLGARARHGEKEAVWRGGASSPARSRAVCVQ